MKSELVEWARTLAAVVVFLLLFPVLSVVSLWSGLEQGWTSARRLVEDLWGDRDRGFRE